MQKKKSIKIGSKTKKQNEISGIGHPVHNEPAFIFKHPDKKNKNVLVIADIHYGIEHSLAKAGARLPSHTKQLTDKIIKLCSRFKVTELILLGDIKHTVPTTSYQEYHELPVVFEQLAMAVDKIHIFPGNHDGNLRRLIPDNLENIEFYPASGAVLYGVGFFHGHTWPDEKVIQSAIVLMAHNHPNVLFVDRLGGQVSYSCWLRGYLDIELAKTRYPNIKKYNPNIILMPAFNDIGSGVPVNVKKPEFLGPLLKNKFIDLDSAKIYLLDGTDLGKLPELIDVSLVTK